MKIRIRSPLLLSTRSWSLIRWSRSLLFVTGIAALAYVGLTLLDARSFQMTAKRSLDSQVQVAEGLKPNQFRPTVNEGDVLGRVDIPRLGLSVAVLQGTTPGTLRLGAGHIADTPLPWEPGNSGIAGHRDTFFRELKNIRKNDEIRFQTATGLFRYEVDWIKIVQPTDITVLESSTDSTLTLVTCYPFRYVGSAPKRFVVRAHKDQTGHSVPGQEGTVTPP